jgi:hypothetical protein
LLWVPQQQLALPTLLVCQLIILRVAVNHMQPILPALPLELFLVKGILQTRDLKLNCLNLTFVRFMIILRTIELATSVSCQSWLFRRNKLTRSLSLHYIGWCCQRNFNWNRLNTLLTTSLLEFPVQFFFLLLKWTICWQSQILHWLLANILFRTLLFIFFSHL